MGKYVEQNLTKNETLVKKAELNPIFIITKWAFAIIWVALAMAVIFAVINPAVDQAENVANAISKGSSSDSLLPRAIQSVVKTIASPLTYVCWAIVVIKLFSATWATIGFFKTELAVTNKRIIGKTGVINTQAMDAPLDKIQNMQVSNGLFGKIFNYGHIEISTASVGGYNFKAIKNIDSFKNIVMQQIDLSEEEKNKAQAEQMAAAMAAAAAAVHNNK